MHVPEIAVILNALIIFYSYKFMSRYRFYLCWQMNCAHKPTCMFLDL